MSVLGHAAGPRLGRLCSLLDPWAVRAAATLRLPDLVAEGADTADELAERACADPDALRRLMRHLGILGLFHSTEEGRWTLTETGELLRDGHPLRLRRTLDQDDPYLRKVDETTHGLLTAVRTGRPVWERWHGSSFWDDLAADPGLGDGFDRQMTRHSGTFEPAIAEGYPWPRAGHVVDVGGGTGRVLAWILNTHPELHGTLVDLPGPVGGAPAVLAEAGVADRVTVAAGSFLAALPPGGDVYLLVNVLHNWGDEDATCILRRCCEAAGAGARVLLAERLVPNSTTDGEDADGEDAAAQALASGTDLYMLLLMGGRERTEEEFHRLGASAGLRHTSTQALPSCPWLTLVEYAVNG